MKIQRDARLWSLAMVGIALTAALLVSESKAAPSTAPPYTYEVEPDNLNKSIGCQKFSDGIVVPVSNVKPNHYVLLLVFDNQDDAAAAGKALFNVDLTEFQTTFGCMVDPAMSSPVGLSSPTPGIKVGIKVQGGCPTDCVGPGLEKARILYSGPDPLKDVPPAAGPDGPVKMHWGIFFGDQEHTGNSPVRVWQIRVANAEHAKLILQTMAPGLSKAPGYMGNLLIGYRPKK